MHLDTNMVIVRLLSIMLQYTLNKQTFVEASVKIFSLGLRKDIRFFWKKKADTFQALYDGFKYHICNYWISFGCWQEKKIMQNSPLWQPSVPTFCYWKLSPLCKKKKMIKTITTAVLCAWWSIFLAIESQKKYRSGLLCL